jgi:hypothetical protein
LFYFDLMTLFSTPEATLTFNSASQTLHLSYNATRLSLSFGVAYQRALEEMLELNIDKLLLDLKRNAPPTEDETEHILQPLLTALPAHHCQPLFIAAVVSEGQYQFQISSYSAATSLTVPPAHIEFNYFTSRRDASAWLSEN